MRYNAALDDKGSIVMPGFAVMSADPSRFTKNSPRAVQLAVKAWRAETAERIILDGDWMNSAGHVGTTTLGNILR